MTIERTPDDLSDFYDDYWDNRSQVTPPDQRQIDQYKSFLKRFTPYRQTGRLLEVGCGKGIMLKAALELGWNADGTDVSPTVMEYVQQHVDTKVYVGPLEQMNFETNVYDVVLCNNVFEHFENPSQAMCVMTAALRPGGLLYIQTLNAASRATARHPHEWYYYNLGHLFVPTLASLQIYADRFGMSLSGSRTHGYTSVPRGRSKEGGALTRRVDKFVAALAGMTGTGHRIEVMMSKK